MCVLSYTHGFMLLFFSYSPFCEILVFMDGHVFHMYGSGDRRIAILFSYDFVAHINGSAEGFSSSMSIYLNDINA